MVSDMVRRGTFHRHIMTSGGRSARPARAGQSDIDRELPAIPAVQTAETQTAVIVVLMEPSCILEVYVAALYAAVPECTCNHGGIQHNRALRTPAGREEPVTCCGAVRSRTVEQRLRALQFVEWRRGVCENYMLLILGVVIVSIAVVIVPRMRVPGDVNGSALGWMSEQWLAEQRASHSA
jgi:hypothetical protein